MKSTISYGPIVFFHFPRRALYGGPSRRPCISSPLTMHLYIHKPQITFKAAARKNKQVLQAYLGSTKKSRGFLLQSLGPNVHYMILLMHGLHICFMHGLHEIGHACIACKLSCMNRMHFFMHELSA